MSELPVISGSACVAVLMWAGFLVKWQKGRHMILRRDEPFTQIVVPDHPELDRATLLIIIHQAGLTVDEFLHVLDAR